MPTLVYEDPKSGRRLIVHLARSVEDRKRSEVIVQRMLDVSKQLVGVSDRSLRPAPVNPLSEQEHRVLHRFSEGKGPADIVQKLDISPQTLRNHLHHINQKLGAHNRLESVDGCVQRTRSPTVSSSLRATLPRSGVRRPVIHIGVSSPVDARQPVEEVLNPAQERRCQTLVLSHRAHSWLPDRYEAIWRSNRFAEWKV